MAIFRGICAKHKLFVYVEPRKTKGAIPTKNGQGVHQKFLTWDEIAEVVESAPPTRGRQKWLREELLDFMKERKMISPPPLNVSKLTLARQILEHQEETLERIFEEAKKVFHEKLNKGGNQRYKVTLGDDQSLRIKKTARGKLKKPMQDDNIWVWCGIYPDEGILYLSLEIGWLKNSYGSRISQFRKTAKKKNFDQFEYEHERYLCECYEISEKLGKVVGKWVQF